MARERKPVELLEFSDDLHYEDVTPLRAFLTARLGELVEAQPEGSGARFAAERLAAITQYDCIFLSDILCAWEDAVLEGRGNEPGWTQRMRQDAMIWWDRLCRTAGEFRDHPDHRPRWRPLRFMNLAHAEFLDGLTDQAGGVYGDGAHP
ncbi:hypothetical protein ATKI12_4340 [Kitasatospora sp. Ki12]|uniref:hypothetical protein n=1 Tax=Kitasatospora xanthocidica TaxID=83382 RepID=UPI0016788F29|nr:hypothetical protein [Kitasatospora xanthocidica]GHF39374.1 hypothetical protein GCM10018790_16480 [Kitasatospora xanthocidica]